MTPYQIGDQVEIRRGTWRGLIGTVTATFGNRYSVTVEGRHGYNDYAASGLRKVEQPTAAASTAEQAGGLTESGEMTEVILTAFQAEEVAGLLAICEDEREEWGKPWGTLTGRVLSVIRPLEAIGDLRHRADWMADEAPGHGSNGAPGARSLRALADQIAARST